MNYHQYIVSIQRINKIKNQLLEVAKMSPLEIMTLWIEPTDTKLTPEELTQIQLNPDYENETHPMPLFKHLIYRFLQQGQSDPGIFIKSAHPSTRRTILVKYGIPTFFEYMSYNTYGKMYDQNVFEFFSWLKTGLCAYSVEEMSINSHSWRTQNSINFFFNQNENNQLNLVNKYNGTFINDTTDTTEPVLTNYFNKLQVNPPNTDSYQPDTDYFGPFDSDSDSELPDSDSESDLSDSIDE